jgi:hypothetical protein
MVPPAAMCWNATGAFLAIIMAMTTSPVEMTIPELDIIMACFAVPPNPMCSRKPTIMQLIAKIMLIESWIQKAADTAWPTISLDSSKSSSGEMYSGSSDITIQYIDGQLCLIRLPVGSIE